MPRLPLRSGFLLLALLLCCSCNDPLSDDDDASDDDDVAGDDDSGDDDDSAQAITETWTLSFPADGFEGIQLGNHLGEISLTGSDGATSIEVLATLHGAAGAEPPASVPVEVSDLDSTLTLTVELPQGLESARIDLLVSAPDTLAADLTGAGYPLSVADMRAGGSIAASTGSITGMGLSGDFAASAGETSILLELELVPGGSLTASLDSGPIELDLPADTSATMQATATGGSVEITGLDFQGVVIDGQAQGSLGAGDGSITLSTGNGDIRLRGHGLPDAEGN